MVNYLDEYYKGEIRLYSVFQPMALQSGNATCLSRTSINYLSEQNCDM